MKQLFPINKESGMKLKTILYIYTGMILMDTDKAIHLSNN